MTKAGKAMNQTDKARVLDMDGNCIAIFPGYNWPGLAAIIVDYPNAFKIRIIDRKGECKATVSCFAK